MKPKHRWISWVSRRFLTGRQGGRGRIVFLFSVVLIASGVTTLNTILAVMNGLQQGYIRSILEIGSYHLRWIPDSEIGSNAKGADESSSYEKSVEVLADRILNHPSVIVALPFREGQTMLRGERARPSGALIRGVTADLTDQDTALAENLEIVDGRFDLSGPGLVIGEELSLILGVSPGDRVTALDLGSPGFSPAEIPLTVTGVFSCGYREYESSLAFVSLESYSRLFGTAPVQLGIKLQHPETDRTVLPELEIIADGYEGRFSSWRDTNRAFFGALRTEKVMMLLILTLVFVVVAVNIDHALRRMATERQEDLALLKSMGASPFQLKLLFLSQGLVIGAGGAAAGSIFGVLAGMNVGGIIRFIRSIWVFFRSGTGAFQAGAGEAFFRSSEVMISDVLTIALLAVLLSSVAGLRAASMPSRLQPAAILRSE